MWHGSLTLYTRKTLHSHSEFLLGHWQCGYVVRAGLVHSQAVLGQSQAVYLVTALTTMWIGVTPLLKGA